MSTTTCYYCKLAHPRVEASGMWHCPNPLCRGPGAAWFRSTLMSYVDYGDRHAVDEVELRTKGLVLLATLEPPIREHATKGLPA